MSTKRRVPSLRAETPATKDAPDSELLIAKLRKLEESMNIVEDRARTIGEILFPSPDGQNDNPSEPEPAHGLFDVVNSIVDRIHSSVYRTSYELETIQKRIEF